MFGLFKKPCEHKRKVFTNISLSETMGLAGSPNIVGEITREVYYCRDCRVLFLPWEGEKIGNFHETTKNHS